MEARTYRIRVDCTKVSIDVLDQRNSLWPSTMKFVENKEYSKNTLLYVSKSIHQAIGWNDLIDASSIHTYIVKIQHEVMIEEKRKKYNGSEGSSKRILKSKKGQQTIPTHEETMKDALSTSKVKEHVKEKQKDLTYKL